MRRQILRDTLLLALAFLALAGLAFAAVARTVDRAAAGLMEKAALPLGRDLAASISEPVLDDLLRGSLSARQGAVEDVRRSSSRSEAIEATVLVGEDGTVLAAEPAGTTPLQLAAPRELFAEDPRPRFLTTGGGWFGTDSFTLEVPLLRDGAAVAYLLLDLDEAALQPLYGPLRTYLVALVATGLAALLTCGLLLERRLRARESYLVRALEGAVHGDDTAFAATATGGFTDVFRIVGRLGRELQGERRRGERTRRLVTETSDLVGVGVLLLDARGELLEHGRVAAELLGVADGVEMRERWRALRPHLPGLADLGKTTPGPLTAEVDAGAVEGERRVRLTAHRLEESGEENCGIVVVVEDPAADTARADERRLADQLRSLGRVRRSVGHDLKGSLNTLGLHVELLRRSLTKEASEKETEKRRSLLAVIDGELKDLLDGLERFLEQAAPASADVITFDVSDVLHELDALLRTHARRQNVTLAIETPDDELTVAGSPSRLRQALLRLAIRGLDASAEAGNPGLMLTAERRDDSIVIAIIDQGHEIAPERRQTLFDIRNDTPETRVGLDVSRALIIELGGTIEVASSDPGYTTLEVRLPAAG